MLGGLALGLGLLLGGVLVDRGGDRRSSRRGRRLHGRGLLAHGGVLLLGLARRRLGLAGRRLAGALLGHAGHGAAAHGKDRERNQPKTPAGMPHNLIIGRQRLRTQPPIGPALAFVHVH